MSHRSTVVEIAKTYIGLPYLWGGDSPTGFDCSGLVVECYKSVGVLPRGGDWTANGLFALFDKLNGQHEAREGDPIFWGRGRHASHVGLYLGEGLYIGAEGGGSWATNVQIALKKGAFIKIRPIDSRRVDSIHWVSFGAPIFRDEQ